MFQKYLVIFIFAGLFSGAVFGLFKIEENIRQARKLVIEIPPKEIIPENITRDQIEEISKQIEIHSRAAEDYLEVYRIKPVIGPNERPEWKWEPIFLKGVNLGTALPGKFATEFSASYDDYYQWLELIGQMGSNVIRIYTILPPEFYQAFARYNFLNSHQPLWLLQGVWADIPEEGNYYDAEYMARFQREIKDAIDVIFGKATIKKRPGHASGTYNRNISEYTLGLILGREWEPKTVMKTNALNQERTRYSGFFFSVPQGSPMECWLAEMMDFAMKYESLSYRYQHPLSFVNWLPLDPMYHNSEYIESAKVREYDNDWVDIDFRAIHITPVNKAGMFAAYHVYPYYPDFVYNDDKYKNFKTDQGTSHYAGYLHDLKAHHRDIPLVIAEYGVPSSRGNSHYAPNGFNQGGHSEQEQGRINAHLTREIYRQGGAGAILFEWIDEWFKFNWLVMDFELPQERRKLWHNKENPEQNFGLMAMEQAKIKIDGNPADWKTRPLVTGNGPLRAFYVDADAAYLYLCFKMDEQFNLSKHDLYVGINTHDLKRGSHYLPNLDERIKDGLEFLLSIRDRSSAYLLVDEPYSVFTHVFNEFSPAYRSAVHETGNFVEQKLLANRQRIHLNGDVIPEIIHYRSKLRFGKSNPALEDFDSLADWYYDPENQVIEVRLTWHMLNVTDPSSRRVLADRKETSDIDSEETDGFTFYILVEDGEQILQKIPRNFGQTGIYYLWEKWEEPEFTSRLKESYYRLKEEFLKLESVKRTEAKLDTHFYAGVTPWPEDRPGAITLTFDGDSYGIIEYAFPELQEYGFVATVGVEVSRIGESPIRAGHQGNHQPSYLTWSQINELQQAGWEIAIAAAPPEKSPDRIKLETLQKSKKMLSEKVGQPVMTLFFPFSGYNNIVREMKESGFLFAKSIINKYNEAKDFNPFHLKSFSILNDNTPSRRQLIQLLENGRGKWTILSYQNIYPRNSKKIVAMKNNGIENNHFITPKNFRRHVRIIRNSGYYVDTLEGLGKYLLVRQNSKVNLQTYKKFAVLTVETTLTPDLYQPITVKFQAPWKTVEVKGSLIDGVYNLRDGFILIKAMPENEIVIENLGGEWEVEDVKESNQTSVSSRLSTF
jgi:peptidoglycan/xylan/chitin deacetylase (PgdA/CDA1 family)